MLICQPSSRVVNLLFSIEEKLKLRIASSSVPLCKWVMASFHPELSKTVKENVIAVTCVVYCYFPTGLKPFSRFLSFKCHEIIDCLRYWWINSPIVFAFQQYLFIRVTPVREHQLENFIIRDLNIRLNRYQSVFFYRQEKLVIFFSSIWKWFSNFQFEQFSSTLNFSKLRSDFDIARLSNTEDEFINCRLAKCSIIFNFVLQKNRMEMKNSSWNSTDLAAFLNELFFVLFSVSHILCIRPAINS